MFTHSGSVVGLFSMLSASHAVWRCIPRLPQQRVAQAGQCASVVALQGALQGVGAARGRAPRRLCTAALQRDAGAENTAGAPLDEERLALQSLAASFVVGGVLGQLGVGLDEAVPPEVGNAAVLHERIS